MSGASRVTITAALAWVEIDGCPQLIRRPAISFDRKSGRITAITTEPELERAPDDEPTLVFDLGRALVIPGMVNAHSHAFQRAIRGVTQRRAHADPSSFWSWREAMYEAATALDPDEVHAVSSACFAEMLRRGITCVGEFHYLHHQPGGMPYADLAEMSARIRDTGSFSRRYSTTGASRPVSGRNAFSQCGFGRQRRSNTKS